MKALILIMATIRTSQADKIMLYLKGQGWTRGGAQVIGPEIVAFLTAQGHTFAGNAQRQIQDMSQSAWNKMQERWMAGNPTIEAFFGLNPYEIEEKYMKNLTNMNPGSYKVEPGKNTTGSPGVGGAKGGAGGIRKKDALNAWNGTGWDNTNIEAIATTGNLDPAYKVKMTNLRSVPLADEFENARTGLATGSALMTYARTPPTVSGATPAPAVSVTPAGEEEEEEIVEEVIAAPVVAYEWEESLNPEEITDLIGESPMTIPTISQGERKVSSKAYAELDTQKLIPLTRGNVEVVMKPLAKTQGIDISSVSVASKSPIAFGDLEALLTAADGIVEAKYTDEDGDDAELLLLPAPTVKFIISIDEGLVYIVINDQMLPASRGTDQYTFTECAIRVHDPTSTKEGVAEVLLDGAPMAYGKWIPKDGYIAQHFDYGFPINGVEGLPAECYEDNYEEDEDDVTTNPLTLSQAALGDFLVEGGRPIVFGKPKTMTYNFDELDEKYLQPLALNFDDTLSDDDAVVFVLNYEGKLNNKTNLFPGQVDDKVAGFTELQMFCYPNDIRNVRPMNEESVVMLQTFMGRKAGDGVKEIMIDSSNLKDTITFSIGGVDYMAKVYTQVQVTFEEYRAGKKTVDEEAVLIPDGDMRFRGMDNTNSELQGELTPLEDESDIANVMVIEGKAQEIYEELEKQRHNARISSKYNVIDDVSKDIVTKTLLVEQNVRIEGSEKKDSMYYLIIGDGAKTQVIKMDMGEDSNE